MNLLANEGVDRPIVERLRRDGHDVVYVAELSQASPMTKYFNKPMIGVPC
jgi:hypothetical protein